MVERKKPGHVKARKMPTWGFAAKNDLFCV
jgi:hypothetical protein